MDRFSIHRLGVIVLLFCALTACGLQEDFKTKHGLYVIDYTDKVQKRDVEIATETLIRYFGAGRKVLRGLVVTFTKNQLVLEGKPRNGLAFVDRHKIKVFWIDSCIANTAFVHELMHIIMHNKINDHDPRHERLEYWDVVNEVNAMLRPDLCFIYPNLR